VSEFSQRGHDGIAAGAYRWLQWPCLLAIVVFAATDQILPQVGHVAQVVFILPALILLLAGIRPRVLKVPALLLLAALLVQLSSWWFAPELAGYTLEATPKLDRLARWMLFLFMVFWLTGRPEAARYLWFGAIGGLLLSPWVTGGGNAEILRGLTGERVDFGLRNAQHTAMFFGAAFLSLFALSLSRIAQEPLPRLTAALIALLLLLTGAGVMITQTRGVWLGTAMGVVVIALLKMRMLSRRGQWTRRRGVPVLLAVAALLTLAILLATQLFGRFEEGRGTFEQLESLDVDALQYDSVGIRARSWIYGVPWILERPLSGWGINGSHLISQRSEALTPELKLIYTHLHSSYLDLAAQYGLPGVLLFLALMLWLLLQSRRAWQRQDMPDAAWLFIAGFTAYWLIINLFEAYMLYSTGRYLLNLVAAGALLYAGPAAINRSGAAR
jgi:O-antigen ligase